MDQKVKMIPNDLTEKYCTIKNEINSVNNAVPISAPTNIPRLLLKIDLADTKSEISSNHCFQNVCQEKTTLECDSHDRNITSTCYPNLQNDSLYVPTPNFLPCSESDEGCPQYGSTPLLAATVPPHLQIQKHHVPDFFKHTVTMFHKHSHTGLNIKHDKLKSTRTLNKAKSKSLTDLHDLHHPKYYKEDKPHSFNLNNHHLFKFSKLFHIPSPHLFSHQGNHKLKPNLQAGDPSGTPLLIPPHPNMVPAIFLCQNTPDSSPRETPCHDPDRRLVDSLEKGSLATSSEEECSSNNKNIIIGGNNEVEDNDSSNTGADELDETDDSKISSVGCVAGLKKRVTKRPVLQIPPNEDLIDDSIPRRPSIMSSLSVLSLSRRPSIGSLLSLTPSVTLGGRRFSFNIGGSRSDQMVSVSFKSLESFVLEDNLVGLQNFLSSRTVVIDDRDENGATALILSALQGKADFCKVFIEHGADVNAEDNDQWTALIIAAKEGHTNVVQTLLDNGANINHREMGGWTALVWASYKGNTDTASLLLRYGADANAQGQHHMTSLVWASGRGHTEIVEGLLDKGAKPNLGDKFGTTPLIWACRNGHYEIAESLLKHRANVDATGMYSWTPLLVATKGNFQPLVHLLLEQKPPLNAADKDGSTALTIACKEGYAEIASALLRAGAYVNIQDRDGDTNLIYACRGGHKTVVESLLQRHAETDVVGKDKKTALYWAVEKNHTQIVKLMLAANADLENATKEGDTALLKAVRNKNAEIVQLLIDRKARVTVADKKGDTALHIAMRSRAKRIVEILLRNPKNSQMLYRPNRAGETPYNIDLSHQKTILGQIFGARRLNTNEENENMLGYDLYSSSLADILSEPSLSMPISVGLYARWGSGKSFLVRKLKEEMSSFARQWVEPLFQFNSLVFTLSLIVSVLLGFITLMATGMWYVGAATGAVLFILILLILLGIWYGSRSKYDWHFCYRWSVGVASQMASFKLIMQVIFCSPPGEQWKEWKEGHHAKPLKFIFAEGAKPSSTGAGGHDIVQILGSLFDMLEYQYGIFPTRFFRAFRPRAHSPSTPWKYRRLCGIPYIAIFFTTLLCALALTYLAVTYGFHGITDSTNMVTEVSVPVKSDGISAHWAQGGEINRNTVKRSAGRNSLIDIDDDDDEEDDEEDDDDDFNNNYKRDDDDFPPQSTSAVDAFPGNDEFGRPLHGKLINPLLFILSALVALVVVANIHTLARMIKALIFSHRRHLVSAISKFDKNAEGYLPTLRNETSLMIDMVKCLDAFTSQQTRLVVVLDGLDSCEQVKVLTVLESVHSLFTDSNGPFIILLAIDPHIITRAIELNATKVFRESSISGHDYLRNIIHLPFYLQNAGLRKVKLAEQAAEFLKGRSHGVWHEQETEVVSLATTSAMGGLHHMPSNRRLSSESGLSIIRRNTAKGSRRLRPSDSVGSSIASNLHRVSAASDLNKVLLTDDYFNDINPRSMRRLMNVVYITGRLLKAFHIEFNWYHLALWVNITEQWPYRASWLIYFYEKNEGKIEEKTSLKDLFDRTKCKVPCSKDIEPLLEMDRDEKKFETFLAMHETVLFVYNLVVFLPFTINLDPFIKKKIKEEEVQNEECNNQQSSTSGMALPWHLSSQDHPSRTSTLSYRGKGHQQPPQHTNFFSSTMPPTMNPLMWGYTPPFVPPTLSSAKYGFNLPLPLNNTITVNPGSLPLEAQDKKLSSLCIDEIFDLMKKVEGVNFDNFLNYKDKFLCNNINGKVLFHCNLDDLKQILGMTFGDWELFKMLIIGLREIESNEGDDLPPVNTQAMESFSDQSEVDGSSFKRGSVRSSKEIKEDPNLHKTPKNIHSKQPASKKSSKASMQSIEEYDSGAEDTTLQDVSLTAKRETDTNGQDWKTFSRQGSVTSIRSESERKTSHSKSPLERQITLEDQMIFGALQTLNEEAFEDVVEEQARNEALTASYHLAALEEDKKACMNDPEGENSRNRSVSLTVPEEVDVVYLQHSPLLPHTVVSSPADEESSALSLASSISPYKGSISLSRSSSLREDSNFTPKHIGDDSLSYKTEGSNASPYKKVLFSSSATSSPIKRRRPQSLNLRNRSKDDIFSINVRKTSPSNDPSLQNGILQENDSVFNCLDEFGSSFSDSFPHQNGPRPMTIVEQFSSGHSLDKIRRLTKKVQRVLHPHDTAQPRMTDYMTSSLEASPLVITSPPTPANSNAAGLINIGQHTEAEIEKSPAPKRKVNLVVTAKSASLEDKETHL